MVKNAFTHTQRGNHTMKIHCQYMTTSTIKKIHQRKGYTLNNPYRQLFPSQFLRNLAVEDHYPVLSCKFPR